MVIIWLMVVNNLVGGWPTPLKNMSSSMGRMTSHIVWTIKNLPNHQPVITVQNKWYPLPLRWWREIGIDADRTLPNHLVFQMADVQNVLVLKWNRENWIQPPAVPGKGMDVRLLKGLLPEKKQPASRKCRDWKIVYMGLSKNLVPPNLLANTWPNLYIG